MASQQRQMEKEFRELLKKIATNPDTAEARASFSDPVSSNVDEDKFTYSSSDYDSDDAIKAIQHRVEEQIAWDGEDKYIPAWKLIGSSSGSLEDSE